MPRRRANGSTQRANRLKVLALVEFEPKISNREIERRIGVPWTTARGIRKKWGGADLNVSDVSDKPKKGRPPSRSKRWMRCDGIKVMNGPLFCLCSGNWPVLARKMEI
jgi:hypothetical protein